MAQKRFSPGSGPSQRQLRVGELIRRRLSEVLSRAEIHDPELNRMSITVGEVRTSPDLKVATAYVMPLGGQGRDEAVAALRRNRYELRHLVAAALALKFAPELRFAPDETFDRMDETRRLLERDDVRRDLAAAGGEPRPEDIPDPDLGPERDGREDLPRDTDDDSDDAGGAADWDDGDADLAPEDFDPYHGEDEGDLVPLDRLIPDDTPETGDLSRREQEESPDNDVAGAPRARED